MSRARRRRRRRGRSRRTCSPAARGGARPASRRPQARPRRGRRRPPATGSRCGFDAAVGTHSSATFVASTGRRQVAARRLTTTEARTMAGSGHQKIGLYVLERGRLKRSRLGLPSLSDTPCIGGRDRGLESAMAVRSLPDRALDGALSALPDHLARVLVVAQAEEARMAQAPRARPLGERDLGDELGLHPRDPALADRRGVGERRVVAGERAHPRAQVAQGLAVEAGADLAGVAQRAAVVVAEQQRAELGARALRSGEAADDELLALLALELQPVARAGGAVRAVGALGDHALPALAARLGEQRLAGPVAVRRQAHAVLEAQRAAQQALARAQRELADVAAVEPDDVEDVEEHRHATVAALGKPREARLRAVEGDDLAVDREPVARLRLERGHELGIAAVERQIVAREQPDARARPDRDAADAVELALEDPVRVAEALVGQDGL